MAADEQQGLFEEMLSLLMNDGSVSREKLVQLYQRVHRKNEQQKRERAEAEAEEQLLAERRARAAAVTARVLPDDYRNPYASGEFADLRAASPTEALQISMDLLNRVDMELIAHLCGQPIPDCIDALRGLVYQDPAQWNECFYRGFVCAEEYLSGYLGKKLRDVNAAAKIYGSFFDDSASALRAAAPAAVPADEIYAPLGAPWLPPEWIDEFVDHLLGPERQRFPGWQSHAACHPILGEWRLPYAAAYRANFRNTHTYGTERMDALEIIERTLNMRPVRVTDEQKSPYTMSGRTRTVNHEETVALSEKQRQICGLFRDWLLSDPERRDRLEQRYAAWIGSVRPRRFDGSRVKLPDISPAVTLYDYQLDAVARILACKNTLLAHEVGSGKTYIMAAAGMAMRCRRPGHRNLYMVPNNIIGQWEQTFRQLFPAAKLFVVTPNDFTPTKREAALLTMRDGDFDGIIIGYSSLEMIPVSPTYRGDRLQERIDTIAAAEAEIRAQRGRSGDSWLTKLRRLRERLESQLESARIEQKRGAAGVWFDDLHIDTLFVDEAHNFKNIPIDTRMDNIPGINRVGSKKCADLMDRVRCVQQCGGGAVFATGTPITNSITDLYVMQTYLQPELLRELGIDTFDRWISAFGELTVGFEIDVDAAGYRFVTRFSRFHNLPELASVFALAADFHHRGASSGLPVFRGHTDVVLPKSPAQAAYIRNITDRAELVRAGAVDRGTDNLLKITTDGRKAALDIRLVEPDAPPDVSSKAAACAERILAIATEQPEVTQIVFCDTSTPKEDFNLYDELRARLIRGGMDPAAIAFVHDATTEKRRLDLFEDVNAGRVRVLLGSTFKLGQGVNVQTRLFALHHLDIPWRPSDMVQREGRILRQGNRNPEIRMYRYITDGSFDAYSWQLLETKQRFIAQLLTHSVTQRSGTDLDETVLSYAEVKALAIGDPLIRRRVELTNELMRLRTLRRRRQETDAEFRAALASIPHRVETARQTLNVIQLDQERLSSADASGTVVDRRAFGEYLLGEMEDLPEERSLGDYRGFAVRAPAHLTKEAPGVWLCGCGRWYAELGTSPLGAVARLDHVLDGLAAKAEELTDELLRLRLQEEELRAAIAAPDEYSAAIEAAEAELRETDRRLGVEESPTNAP